LWLCCFFLRFPTLTCYASCQGSAAFCWRFRPSGMSCCVTGLVSPKVLTDRLAALTQLHSITF
jgi:hypothetical protein